MRTISVPSKKVMLLTLMLALGSIVQSFATTYYSRTNNGLWNVASTWSTVTYGNATNTGTFPKKGDVVYIGDGYTISMNMNAVCASVTVGQGTSGNLEFSTYLTFTMTVAGTLTINNGGRFGYLGNASRMHNLYVSGNIVNNGILDLYSDANDYVNLTFNSKVNSQISGTGTFDLNKVTLYKSTLKTYTLDVMTNAFETATRNLVVTYGTYIHNNTGTYSVDPAMGNYTIQPDAIFSVPSGIMHFSPASLITYLQGTINVSGGTVRIGSTSGTTGLRYDKSTTQNPTLNIISGNVEVYGGINNRTSNATSPFVFNMTGGNVLLNSGTTGTTESVFRMNDVAGSAFTMVNGIITLQNPNSTGVSDFDLGGTNTVVSPGAGSIYFGNTATSASAVFNFTPYANIVQPNFRITGASGNAISLRTSASSTVDFSLLSLYIDVNKTFDFRSISGTAGDTKTMTLTDNYDGINSFYNDGTFTRRSSTVKLQGAEGLWMSGATTTTFYNLTIDNSFGVSLAAPLNVSHTLTLTNGIVYTTTTSIITCLSGATSTIGSAIAFVDGPFANNVASALPQSLNIPIGKNGIYRPMILAVRHSNAVNATYTSEAWNASARAMGYTVPGTFAWVSDIRYFSVNRTGASNLATARVTLSYGSDDIVTDYANLRVGRASGSTWVDVGGTGTANGSGSITSGSFTSFGSMFTLGNSSSGSNPLPVELVSFLTKRNDKSVAITWSTASEKNSDYFDVERSRDGKVFEKIARVKSAGNSTTLMSYSATDNTPFAGINYYRLKQVDFDGTSEYSAVKSVLFGTKGSISLYPNPVNSESVTVKLPSDINGELKVDIIDLSGKIVYSNSFDSQDQGQLQLNIKNIVPQGSYILKVSDSAGQQLQDRLMVLNK